MQVAQRDRAFAAVELHDRLAYGGHDPALQQILRLRIFRALVGAGPQGLTPGALSLTLDVPGSTLSFHLKELAQAGLVTQERASRNLIYRAAFGHMNELLGFLTQNCCEGAACAVQDAAINLLGPRPQEIWSENETLIGRGFAGFPLDNIGVQYGLKALQQGLITPAQFVDLNVRIGAADEDANLIPERVAAVEPALSNAYRTGLINETNNMDQVAIIDCRGPDPGAFHDAYRAFAVRARLDREHGHRS